MESKRTKTKKINKKNKKKNLIMLLIFLIVIIAIGVVVATVVSKNTKNEGEYVEISDDGTKTNISSILNKDKKFDDLDITNISLKSDGQITKLTATITNNTKEARGGYPAKAVFIDSNNNKIDEMGLYINKLEKGESTVLNASITFDYTNVYDIVIEK